MDDELFYEQAAAEVAADRIKAGLYAKAFSQADGDKTVAQARYLRLRAEQLAAEACLAKKVMEEAGREDVDYGGLLLYVGVAALLVMFIITIIAMSQGT
jgi:hypothetical protein